MTETIEIRCRCGCVFNVMYLCECGHCQTKVECPICGKMNKRTR